MTRIRSVITLGLASLYLSNVFLRSGVLAFINILLVVLVLVLSLLVVSGSTRIISYSFFIVSAALLFYYKAP